MKKYNKGIIAASACLGGVYAGNYWENREEGDEAVLSAMRDTSRNMVDIFGDRWYAELQWNNIPEQHELNQHIIQIAEEFDIGLISTADSHYPNPDAWKDRELYKRLGWLGKGKPSWAEDSDSELPVGVEEIGYELYPKERRSNVGELIRSIQLIMITMISLVLDSIQEDLYDCS